MREELQARCEAFIDNREVLKQVYRMENSHLYPVCANIFVARGVPAREEELRRCRDLLKAHTSVFSNFRGSTAMPVVSLLAVSPDPEDKVRRMVDLYGLLRESFFGSQYLALAALMMTELPAQHPDAEMAARGRALYNRMKKEHPFLTSGEDSVMAVLLAYSEKDDDHLIAEMEDCYNRLKTAFRSSNDVQAASHVLALGPGSTLEKTARMLSIYEKLQAAGAKYGKYRELSALAALSILPISPEDAAADMLDIDDFLSRQKGYGFWGIDRRTRMMHAALIAADQPVSLPAEAAALSATLAAIAAQQAAMMSVVITTSASSAASSSH